MGRIIAAFAQFLDGEGDPLVKGWLKFLEPGSNNTTKNTYVDENFNVANANPAQLDAEGRCPSIFGTGNYRVVSYTNELDVLGVEQPGQQIQLFDPVAAEAAGAAGGSGTAFDTWDSGVTYGLADIVAASGNYYRSLVVTNFNNNPAVSEFAWERIDFLQWWNNTVSYEVGDLVFYDGNLYFSLQTLNINQQPDATPAYWVPLRSSAATPIPELYVGGIYFPAGGDIGTSALPVSDIYLGNIYFPAGGDIGIALLPVSVIYVTEGQIGNLYFPAGGSIGTALLPVSNIYTTEIQVGDIYFPAGGDIGTALLPVSNIYTGAVYLSDDKSIVLDSAGDATISYVSADSDIVIANAAGDIKVGSFIFDGLDLIHDSSVGSIGNTSNYFWKVYTAEIHSETTTTWYNRSNACGLMDYASGSDTWQIKGRTAHLELTNSTANYDVILNPTRNLIFDIGSVIATMTDVSINAGKLRLTFTYNGSTYYFDSL